MTRLVTYRGKAWTAAACGSIITDGATRTKVLFTREDTGDQAKGWVHGSIRDFTDLPLHTLTDALMAALGPKKVQCDWE